MKRNAKPFKVVLKFDLGGLGALGHQTFTRHADSRADARMMIAGVRSGSFRRGSWVIPGTRLLYARIYDERRNGS